MRRFFDDFASRNKEQHGPPDQLMQYRISLVKAHADIKPEDVLLDIGCGNGHHLLALNGPLNRGIGVDISAKMIASAQSAVNPAAQNRLQFNVDDAHVLATLADASVHVAICIGALEHMPDKQAVLQSVYRVLYPGGRFVCLTPNDQFFWYRWLAPILGLPTRHLATDQRLDAQSARILLENANFSQPHINYWSFIPRGDMPAILGHLCGSLDFVGKFLSIKALRSGLIVTATKPRSETNHTQNLNA